MIKNTDTIKLILIGMFICLKANALVGSTTVQLFDLTNPSGADQFSLVQDVSERNGYSIHCDVTSTLQLTTSIYASDQKITSPTQTQAFTQLTGTTQVITNTGFMYDVVKSNVGYVKLKIGTFSGTGTLKCYLTAKDY